VIKGKPSIMKVGPGYSNYANFSHSSRKPQASAAKMADLAAVEKSKQTPPSSDTKLIADFHARMARQSLEWADSDHDGKLTKAEYTSGQSKLAELNHRPDDKKGSEDSWAAIDATGKGWVDEAELEGAFAKILPVSVGHLDPGFAERLRNPRG
jgi:hypothetical protein